MSELKQLFAKGGVALIDLEAAEASGWRVKLRFTGDDRVRYLNGQVSNDTRRLQPVQGGEALAACVMNAKGKMNAYCRIHATENALFLDAEGAPVADDAEDFREALAMRLERYIIADDVELADVTEELAMLHFAGSAEALERQPLQSLLEEAGGSGAQWRRTERLGIPGIDLMIPAAEKTDWMEKGQRVAEVADREAVELFRIQQGIPRWGHELDENTLPAEAGLDRAAIDFHKGCYIGQEIISRIKSVGRVNRRLVRISSAAPLEAGMELFDHEGKSAGTITSAIRQPSGESTALGYLKRGRSESGLTVGRAEADKTERIPVELLAIPPIS